MIKENPSLKKHLEWFQTILNLRINHYFEASETPFIPPPAPRIDRAFPLDQTFKKMDLDWEEKIIILLALVPHLSPHTLDIFFTINTSSNRPYTEFGGLRGKNHNGFLPTKETAVFIIAGTDLNKRIEVMRILVPEHPLFRQQILSSSAVEPGEPLLSTPLNVSRLFLTEVLWDEKYIPDFGADFPAKKVSTNLDWEDLVLPPFVMEEVMEIKSWITHEELIQEKWALKKLIKPGFKSLFYGPPGTGKTLTATLLGKVLSKEVYRIDLAMTISKYIGETEKNLAKVFDLAEHNDWILFFDEADALFGKRTVSQSSNDRYANQEVSYLLQRIEDFPGLIILASNFKSNIDDAFARRFQSMIYFPVPDQDQRFALWQKAFEQGPALEEDIDLPALAEKYEVSGGDIINVLRYAAIQAANRPKPMITLRDIMTGLRKEFHKSGGTLNL